MTAAASVRASARKAPRASGASSTPEPMDLSPSLAALLAKYNPPSNAGSEAPSLPPSLPSSQPPSAPPAPPAASAANAVAARPAPAAPPPAAPAAAAPLRRLPTPPSEDDTRSLYEQLIRSRDVPRPAAVAAPPPARPLPPPLPLPSVPELSRAPSGLSPGVSGIPRPATARPAATPPLGGPGEARRSVTPLSARRGDWAEHDRQLAEKLAGLEQQWAASGQKGRASVSKLPRAPGEDGGGGVDLRRSWAVGDSLGGAGGFAAALERALSPPPSRAAAEASAAAALLADAAGGGGGDARRGGARGSGGMGPIAEAPLGLGLEAEASLRGLSLRDAEEGDGPAGAAGARGVGLGTTPRRSSRAGGVAPQPAQRVTPSRRTGGGATPGVPAPERSASPVAVTRSASRRAAAATTGAGREAGGATTPGGGAARARRTALSPRAAVITAAAPLSVTAHGRSTRGTSATLRSSVAALPTDAAAAAGEAFDDVQLAPARGPPSHAEHGSGGNARDRLTQLTLDIGRVSLPQPFVAETAGGAASSDEDGGAALDGFAGFPLSRREPRAAQPGDDQLLPLPPPPELSTPGTPTARSPLAGAALGREAPLLTLQAAGGGASVGGRVLAGVSPRTMAMIHSLGPISLQPIAADVPAWWGCPQARLASRPGCTRWVGLRVHGAWARGGAASGIPCAAAFFAGRARTPLAPLPPPQQRLWRPPAAPLRRLSRPRPAALRQSPLPHRARPPRRLPRPLRPGPGPPAPQLPW
jgi:hypothetical protein